MTIEIDDLGPEVIVHVSDVVTGMRGILVIDNTVLGPTGGGCRMMPNITDLEVAQLARSMTYKFGILGLPRGGCKSGLWGDPAMPAEEKRGLLRAFGRALQPLLETKAAAVGPDMGVTAADVRDIYDGAGVAQLRSGLFERVHEGDPAAYHITGHGVIASAMAAAEVIGMPFRGARIAVEGFGQVGAGTCRRAVREGAVVVGISTLEGGLHDEGGLDVEQLLALRRTHGDRLVHEYRGGERIPSESIYFVPADVVVPGARPWVIDEGNCARVQARIVASGGNITVTRGADQMLFQRGVLSVPDFIASAAAALASWVDFLGGSLDHAFGAIDRVLGGITTKVVQEAQKAAVSPYEVATGMVRKRIDDARGQPRKTFEQTREEIRALLGM